MARKNILTGSYWRSLGPRGDNSVKVDDFICKILPLMPIIYEIFWQNLPSSSNAKDLEKMVLKLLVIIFLIKLCAQSKLFNLSNFHLPEKG